MKMLELKIPPPVVFVVCLVLMYWTHSDDPAFVVSLPLPELGFAICFVSSGLFGLGGLYEFKKEKTTVLPADLHKTTKVVSTGVYRLSRNPMYMALLFLLIGYAYWQQDLVSFFICFFFVVCMNKIQIKPEEAHLEQRFGEEYIAYKKKVRRWI